MGSIARLRHGLPLAALLALGLAFPVGAAAGPGPQAREMAVTFDDLPGVVAPGEGIAQLRTLTEKLLRAIAASGIPAVGFVNEGKLAPRGSPEPDRVALLARWLDAGFELGNHTYSHFDLHRTPLAEFEEDAARGEETTRGLLAARGSRLRYFRHPFLHTGRSLETRRELEEFLAKRGSRVAPVTIDNSEWIFAKAYALARQRGDRKLAGRVADTYVSYMEAMTDYCERQSRRLFSREIRQVLLLHANALNADHFTRLVRRLRARGYSFITLDRALEDPAYASADTFTGPGGITWLHRWALTSRGQAGILPNEPPTPPFILKAANLPEE